MPESADFKSEYIACDFYEAEEPKSRPSCDLFWFCKVKFSSMGLKILKSSNFRAKSAFGPNLKAGMDATILKESFATI